jgi:hypothetical protein
VRQLGVPLSLTAPAGEIGDKSVAAQCLSLLAASLLPPSLLPRFSLPRTRASEKPLVQLARSRGGTVDEGAVMALLWANVER